MKYNIYIEKSEGVCHRRLLDLQKIVKYLELNKYSIVKHISQADITILYTCAFNQYMEEESFNRLDKLLLQNSNIIVVGCSPNIAYKKLMKYNLVTIPHRSYELLDNYFYKKIKWKDVNDVNIRYSPERSLFLFKLVNMFWQKCTKRNIRRFDIQVEWGCNSNCTYCADKFSVGDTKSKTLNMCLTEFSKALDLGYTDIKLLGDDVGSWGLDINSNYIKLLDAFTKTNKQFNITVKELNVFYIIKYLSELVPILKRGKIKTLHIGFQSGSNRILSLMKRGYFKEDIIKAMNEITKIIPVTCSIIVGFPTETNNDFLDSLVLIEMFNFLGGDVFIYQDREGTDAFNLFPKVSEHIKKERLFYAKKILEKRYNIKMMADKLYFNHGIIQQVVFKFKQKIPH